MCKPSPLRPDLWQEPANCPTGTPYTVPSGYARIPDDACVITSAENDYEKPLQRVCTGDSPDPTTPVPTVPSPIQSRLVRPTTAGRDVGHARRVGSC